MTVVTLPLPAAHATPTNPDYRELNFVRAAQASGLAGDTGTADIIRTGWAVCNEIVNQGKNPTSIAGEFHDFTQLQALAFINLARMQLCP
jgi:hypothetical protein